MQRSFYGNIWNLNFFTLTFCSFYIFKLKYDNQTRRSSFSVLIKYFFNLLRKTAVIYQPVLILFCNWHLNKRPEFQFYILNNFKLSLIQNYLSQVTCLHSEAQYSNIKLWELDFPKFSTSCLIVHWGSS